MGRFRFLWVTCALLGAFSGAFISPAFAQSHRDGAKTNCDASITMPDYRIRTHVELGAPLSLDRSNWILDILGHDGMIRDASGVEIVDGELTRGGFAVTPTPDGMALRFEPPRRQDTTGEVMYGGRALRLVVSLDHIEVFNDAWGQNIGEIYIAPDWLWHGVQNAKVMEILLVETYEGNDHAAAWGRVSLENFATLMAEAKEHHQYTYNAALAANPEGTVPKDLSWDPCR